MSLKVVPLESLGTVSYSHSIATGRIFGRFDTIHERDRDPAMQQQHDDGKGRTYAVHSYARQ